MHFSVCDAHSDALSRVVETGGVLTTGGQFSLDKTEEYQHFTQILALWAHGNFERSVIEQLSAFYREKERSPQINFCKCGADMKPCGINIFLSMEGGEGLGESLETLRFFYQRGVRMLGITWNHDNQLGGGAYGNGRLTSFGKEVLLEMEKLGMILDLSHTNEGTFFDCLEHSLGSVYASHSNSAYVTPHVRNLSDEQFLSLKERNGVVGINLYPEFLGGNTLDDALCHIEHFMALGGEKNIGLGADFDGISDTPEDCPNAKYLYRLGDSLLAHNYKEETVRDILSRNMERFLKNSLE